LRKYLKSRLESLKPALTRQKHRGEGLKHRTPNIQHRTLNVTRSAGLNIRRSVFSVGCSMFSELGRPCRLMSLQGKAAEDCRTPRRYRDFQVLSEFREVFVFAILHPQSSLFALCRFVSLESKRSPFGQASRGSVKPCKNQDNHFSRNALSLFAQIRVKPSRAIFCARSNCPFFPSLQHSSTPTLHHFGL
jgi:hypothetical protein